MKKSHCLFLVLLILFSLCSCGPKTAVNRSSSESAKDSSEKAESSSQSSENSSESSSASQALAESQAKPLENAYIEVPLRFYEGDNVLEFPQIKGAENDAVSAINKELFDWFNQLKDTYSKSDYGWCEAIAYPTETERYLNIVLTFCEFPTYATYGEIFSWVYDKQTGRQITLEEALKTAQISRKALEASFEKWVPSLEPEKSFDGIDSLAFRMLPDGSPQILAGVNTFVEGAGNWVCFYTWKDGYVPASVPYYPVDPSEITGDYGEPLYCQQSEN